MEIPEGWSEHKFDKVVDLHHGFQFREHHFSKEGIPIVKIGNLVADKGIDISKASFVPLNLKDEFEKFNLEAGDILMALTGGTLGKMCRVQQGVEIAFQNYRVGNFKPINSLTIEKEYLYYILSSTTVQTKISDKVNEAAQPNIGKGDFGQIKIKLPPLIEQQRIAEIFGTWDRAISVTEALIVQSEAQKKALMQQLLTGKRRLPGFEGDWQEVRLEDVANIVMGSSPKSEFYNDLCDGLPLLQGNADIKNGRSAPRIFTSEITKVCEKGDVLLSVRAPVGTIAVSDHKACIGRGVAALRAKNGIPQSYIFAWLKHYEWSWITFSQGSTFEAINSTDVKNRKIFMSTDSDELTAIAAILSNAGGECFLLKAKLQTLKTEKSALMQQLLTGKRRVKLTEVAG